MTPALRKPLGPAAPRTPEPLPFRLPLYGNARPPLRQSSVVAAEQCLRRWAWGVLWGLRPVGRSAALDVGSYLHLGLAAAFHAALQGPLSPKDARGLMARTIRRAHDALLREPEELRRPAALPDTELRDHLLRARVGLACAVRLYEEFTREVLDKTRLRVMAVEAPLPGTLRLPVGPGGAFIDVPSGGQIDVVLCNEARTAVWLIDWKSLPSAVRKSHFQTGMEASHYPHRLQAWLYTVGAEQFAESGEAPWRGMRVMGFYHGCIRKPGIRLKTGRGQTVADYIAECHEWWDGAGRWSRHAADRAEEPACRVHRVQMTPSLRDAAIRRVVRHLRDTDELLHLAASRPEDVLKFAPMTESACLSRDRPCPYVDLCLEPRASLRDTLRRRYVQSGDPLDSDPRRVPREQEGDDDDER